MQKYREVVRILRKHCPLAFPCSVCRVKLSGDDGYCSKTRNKFVIRINKSINEQQAIDTLIHEWAHARAWSHLHDHMDDEQFIQKSHDAAWGVAYSEVYMAYEKYFLGVFSCAD